MSAADRHGAQRHVIKVLNHGKFVAGPLRRVPFGMDYEITSRADGMRDLDPATVLGGHDVPPNAIDPSALHGLLVVRAMDDAVVLMRARYRPEAGERAGGRSYLQAAIGCVDREAWRAHPRAVLAACALSLRAHPDRIDDPARRPCVEIALEPVETMTFDGLGHLSEIQRRASLAVLDTLTSRAVERDRQPPMPLVLAGRPLPASAVAGNGLDLSDAPDMEEAAFLDAVGCAIEVLVGAAPWDPDARIARVLHEVVIASGFDPPLRGLVLRRALAGEQPSAAAVAIEEVQRRLSGLAATPSRWGQGRSGRSRAPRAAEHVSAPPPAMAAGSVSTTDYDLLDHRRAGDDALLDDRPVPARITPQGAQPGWGWRRSREFRACRRCVEDIALDLDVARAADLVDAIAGLRTVWQDEGYRLEPRWFPQDALLPPRTANAVTLIAVALGEAVGDDRPSLREILCLEDFSSYLTSNRHRYALATYCTQSAMELLTLLPILMPEEIELLSHQFEYLLNSIEQSCDDETYEMLRWSRRLAAVERGQAAPQDDLAELAARIAKRRDALRHDGRFRVLTEVPPRIVEIEAFDRHRPSENTEHDELSRRAWSLGGSDGQAAVPVRRRPGYV